MNLIDELRATLRSSGLEDGFPIVALRDAGESDLAVIAGKGGDPRTGAAQVAEVLRDQEEIASARRTGPRLLLRFEDELLADLGGRLEVDDPAPLATEDLLAGHRAVVQFCNPNTTKGLHVGHLRNAAIGQSFACALEAAGSDVERQCEVGDSGQQVGEAMAGCLLYGEGSSPRTAGRKGDQLVGDWYARYVRENAVIPEGLSEHDMPVARELTKQDDLAGSLNDRLLDGDPEATDLWLTVRKWVLDGQRETLGRLGIDFDREVCTSEYMSRIEGLVEVGLEQGIFEHGDDGVLFYGTGREEYPRFPLARPDGASTMNLRSLTIWHELISELPQATYVHVCGMEWREHTLCVEEILEGLRPGVSLEATHDVVHGMVSTDMGVASSSEGTDVLVDDLLDRIAASPRVVELAVDGRRGCEAEDLAVVVAFGFCQDRPMPKTLKATPVSMLDEQTSTGLLLARAWARANQVESDGAPNPDPEDPVYRFAVVQSQVFRQLLLLGLKQIDLLDLIRFLARFSEWYLAQEPSPSTDRVMRAVLGKGLRTLGLLRPSVAAPVPGIAAAA